MANNKGRQIQILGLISEGYTSAEIGLKLEISTKTVEVHRYRMMIKFKAKNTAHLIAIAFRDNLIQ